MSAIRLSKHFIFLLMKVFFQMNSVACLPAFCCLVENAIVVMTVVELNATSHVSTPRGK